MKRHVIREKEGIWAPDRGHGEIIIYRDRKGEADLEVRLEGDTLWLTQAQIGLLFEKERSVITKHLRNVFRSGELKEKSNVQKMHIAISDKPVLFYNLDVIMIAESKPRDKGPVINIVVNLISGREQR